MGAVRSVRRLASIVPGRTVVTDPNIVVVDAVLTGGDAAADLGRRTPHDLRVVAAAVAGQIHVTSRVAALGAVDRPVRPARFLGGPAVHGLLRVARVAATARDAELGQVLA